MISRRIGHFAGDRRLALLLIAAGLLLSGRVWLAEHTEHNPWAPLDLRDPVGWATDRKLLALREDAPACRAVLERSDIAHDVLEPAGEGACRREDRTRLTDYPLSPDTPPVTCPASIALLLWERDVIDIAGFVLADGTRISVLRDWPGEGDKARFLRTVRDGACDGFATVLSPDYNAAHADHFHLDMSPRWRGVCR